MKAAVKLPEVTANFKNDHGLTVEWVSTQENCAHLHAKVEANSDFKLPHSGELLYCQGGVRLPSLPWAAASNLFVWFICHIRTRYAR